MKQSYALQFWYDTKQSMHVTEKHMCRHSNHRNVHITKHETTKKRNSFLNLPVSSRTVCMVEHVKSADLTTCNKDENITALVKYFSHFFFQMDLCC